MSDELDFATDLSQREIDAIIAARQWAQASADNCEECGRLIPSARQIAVPGCTMCVDCADRFESGGRR